MAAAIYARLEVASNCFNRQKFFNCIHSAKFQTEITRFCNGSKIKTKTVSKNVSKTEHNSLPSQKDNSISTNQKESDSLKSITKDFVSKTQSEKGMKSDKKLVNQSEHKAVNHRRTWPVHTKMEVINKKYVVNTVGHTNYIGENSVQTNHAKITNKHAFSHSNRPVNIVQNDVNEEVTEPTVTGKIYMQKHLKAAQNSILVLVNKHDDLKQILSAVTYKYGAIKKAVYVSNQSNRQDQLLVELTSSIKSLSCMDMIVSFSDLPVPAKAIEVSTDIVETHIHVTKRPVNLNSCKNLTEQIECWYQNNSLSEGMVRLHFFVAALLRESIQEKNEMTNVYYEVFGSTSCGLAKEGSADVDINVCLAFTEQKDFVKWVQFHSKLFHSPYRLPLAKVPIIRIQQKHTDIWIDMTVNEPSGSVMGEVLYWLNSMDSHLYPLSLIIKHWGQLVDLKGPPPKFSSFMFTMLVTAFLQHFGYLPALSSLYKLKELSPNNKYNYSNNMIHNLHLKWASRNHSMIMVEKFYDAEKLTFGDLLIDFFKFYQEFNFRGNVIDIYHGKITKQKHKTAIQILSPLDLSLNVCRNVDNATLDVFQKECKNALQILENYATVHPDVPWGLEKLFSTMYVKQRTERLSFDIESL